MLSPLLLWLKALHLIAMVAWFAGLFYMFRIFVYHTENASNAEMAGVFKTMAERLYRIITTPALVATFLFGFLMLRTVGPREDRPGAGPGGLSRLHRLRAQAVCGRRRVPDLPTVPDAERGTDALLDRDRPAGGAPAGLDLKGEPPWAQRIEPGSWDWISPSGAGRWPTTSAR
jgi:hypothetical protein